MLTRDLVQYEATIKALAELKTFPEVKKIRDQAVAVQEYAKQAKDSRIISPATEIRVSAETRAGELLIAMAESGERDRGSGDRQSLKAKSQPVTQLADLKISKMQSSRWQALARMKKTNPKKWNDRLKKIIAMNVASITDSAGVVKAARHAMRLERMKRRKQRIKEIVGKIKKLPLKKYHVIYADPEWDFKTWDGLSQASQHYATSSIDEIKKRDVASISAPDSVLFLWAIVPMLPHALEVMDAWGFKYVSHVIWHKDRGGTGYWFTNWHELLLVGTKGNIPAPLPGTQWPSVVQAKRTAHSAKPEEFRNMIDEYFDDPTIRKLEMNLRGKPAKGWDGWGAEALEAAE